MSRQGDLTTGWKPVPLSPLRLNTRSFLIAC